MFSSTSGRIDQSRNMLLAAHSGAQTSSYLGGGANTTHHGSAHVRHYPTSGGSIVMARHLDPSASFNRPVDGSTHADAGFSRHAGISYGISGPSAAPVVAKLAASDSEMVLDLRAADDRLSSATGGDQPLDLTGGSSSSRKRGCDDVVSGATAPEGIPLDLSVKRPKDFNGTMSVSSKRASTSRQTEAFPVTSVNNHAMRLSSYQIASSPIVLDQLPVTCSSSSFGFSRTAVDADRQSGAVPVIRRASHTVAGFRTASDVTMASLPVGPTTCINGYRQTALDDVSLSSARSNLVELTSSKFHHRAAPAAASSAAAAAAIRAGTTVGHPTPRLPHRIHQVQTPAVSSRVPPVTCHNSATMQLQAAATGSGNRLARMTSHPALAVSGASSCAQNSIGSASAGRATYTLSDMASSGRVPAYNWQPAMTPSLGVDLNSTHLISGRQIQATVPTGRTAFTVASQYSRDSFSKTTPIATVGDGSNALCVPSKLKAAASSLGVTSSSTMVGAANSGGDVDLKGPNEFEGEEIKFQQTVSNIPPSVKQQSHRPNDHRFSTFQLETASTPASCRRDPPVSVLLGSSLVPPLAQAAAPALAAAASTTPAVGVVAGIGSPGSRRVPVANVHPIMKDSVVTSSSASPTTMSSASAVADGVGTDQIRSAVVAECTADQKSLNLSSSVEKVPPSGVVVPSPSVPPNTSSNTAVAAAGGAACDPLLTIRDIPDIPLLVRCGQPSAVAVSSSSSATGNGMLLLPSSAPSRGSRTSMTSHHMEFVKFLNKNSVADDETGGGNTSARRSSETRGDSGRRSGDRRFRINHHHQQQQQRNKMSSVNTAAASASGGVLISRRSLTAGFGTKRSSNTVQTAGASKFLLHDQQLNPEVRLTMLPTNDANAIGSAVTSTASQSTDLVTSPDNIPEVKLLSADGTSLQSANRKTPIVYLDDDDGTRAASPGAAPHDAAVGTRNRKLISSEGGLPRQMNKRRKKQRDSGLDNGDENTQGDLASDSQEDRGSDATPASAAIIVTSSGSGKKRRRTNIDLHLSPSSAGDNDVAKRRINGPVRSQTGNDEAANDAANDYGTVESIAGVLDDDVTDDESEGADKNGTARVGGKARRGRGGGTGNSFQYPDVYGRRRNRCSTNVKRRSGRTRQGDIAPETETNDHDGGCEGVVADQERFLNETTPTSSLTAPGQSRDQLSWPIVSAVTSSAATGDRRSAGGRRRLFHHGTPIPGQPETDASDGCIANKEFEADENAAAIGRESPAASGETILHQAARLNYQEVVLYLLESHKVNPNVQDNNGTTPLHISASLGHLTITRLLLAYGALPNLKSVDDTRPIHCAASNNHLHIARQLLKYGADVTLTDGCGKTPMQLASCRPLKQFLRGVLSDLGQLNKQQEIPWEFRPSFDKLGGDCDILDDLPPSDDEEAELVFDVSTEPMLPVYRLQGDGCHKPANNYHSFRDVINFRSAKSDEVEKLAKRCYVSFNSVETRLQLSVVPRQRDAKLERMLTTASEDSVIELVELNAALKRHVNVDSFTVNGRLSYNKVPSTGQKKGKDEQLVELGTDQGPQPTIAADSSNLQLPVIVKHECLSDSDLTKVAVTADDLKDQRFTSVANGNSDGGNDTSTINKLDSKVSVKREADIDDVKKCFNDDDDEREMPELTLYA